VVERSKVVKMPRSLSSWLAMEGGARRRVRFVLDIGFAGVRSMSLVSMVIKEGAIVKGIWNWRS
jgi:hypothetical protein